MATNEEVKAQRREQLNAMRQAAGGVYASAARAYLDAYCELNAIELTLANANVAGGLIAHFNDRPMMPSHNVYLTDTGIGAISTRVPNRHHELLKQFDAD